jgi:FixJ family two-component response regulator
MAVPLERQPADPIRRLICIVDDDDAVAHSLKVFLETSGFNVQTYCSGAQFLADYRHRTAGCLIIDLHMPGLDGLEVVKELQLKGVRLPTILVSGGLDRRVTQRAASLGVTEIIEKPFSAHCIVRFVQTSLAEL